MTILFPNTPHVTTLWLPQLQPTRATVISTVLGLALCSVFATAAVVLFMVYCLEQRFSVLRTALTFVTLVAAIGVRRGGLQRINGTERLKDPWPSAQRSAALENARKAAQSDGRVERTRYTGLRRRPDHADGLDGRRSACHQRRRREAGEPEVRHESARGDVSTPPT